MKIAMMHPLESRTLLAAGSIDRTFGSAGSATVATSVSSSAEHVVLPLPDGTILTAMQTDDPRKGGGTRTHVHIRKLTSSGANDPRFTAANASGEVVVNVLPSAPQHQNNRLALAYAGHGRFLVVNGNGLTRFNGNGSLDTSFSTGGSVVLNDTTIGTLAIERDGSILFGGLKQSSIAATVGRLNANGSRDESFGTDGLRLVPIDTSAFSDGTFSSSTSHIALAPDGSAYVVAGYHAETISDDPEFPGSVDHEGLIFEHLKPDGSLDTGFDGDGVMQSVDNISGTSEFVLSVRVLPDGALRLLSQTDLDFAPFMHTIDQTGVSRDTASGPFDFNSDEGLSASVGLPDGSFIVARNQTISGKPSHQIAHWKADGKEDAAFRKTATTSAVTHLALASNGSILATTADPTASQDVSNVVLRRFWADDAPVAELNAASFAAGRSGSQVFTVTYRADEAIDVASLGNRNVRVTGPNNFVAYAKFDRVAKTRFGGTLVQARYKLAAPGGTWDGADVGTYSVRLHGFQVDDVSGHRVRGQPLGTFGVLSTSPTGIPQSARPDEGGIEVTGDVGPIVR